MELSAVGKRKRVMRRKDEILSQHKKEFEEKEKENEKLKNKKVVE